MSKQSLLLVDGDVRSMRVLEVSLRKAGFSVTTAVSVQDGLDKLELVPPDLIISETTFPEGDGFELRRRVRAAPDWSEIPFIFLTAEAAIENKIKGLELGVDDYLTKPIYIKEIVTRINILLQKRQRTRFEERRDGRTRFAGRVSDMPVVDVIQTIEISRKSGVIQFVGERGRQATIYFRDGKVIDAESGALQGEDAVYRLLTWNDGEFEVVFRTVRRREVIVMSSQGLLMEGMRRLDEWSRLLEQLPPVTHRFEVDAAELVVRLGDIPDDNNGILRLIDGKRTLLEVIDASNIGDLECLQAISRLYFEDMLIDLDHGAPARRDTGRPMPLVEVDSGGSPIQDAASGRTYVPADDGDTEEPPAVTASGSMPAAARFDTGADLEPAVASGPSTRHGAGVIAAASASDSGPGAATGAEPERAVDAPALPDSDASEPADPQGADEPSDLPEPPAHPGELHGSYRPSSLRLIDEAVAAAQAIEPSLFDDLDTPVSGANPFAAEAPTRGSFSSEDPTPVNSRLGAGVMAAVIEGEADESDSVPRAIAADGAARPPRARRTTKESIPPRSRDDSTLRMIGSLGRDRAEASGELARFSSATPVAETQRELVTILPRRITRELTIVTEGTEASSHTDSAPAAASPVALPPLAAATALDAKAATAAAAALAPRRDLAPRGTVLESRGPSTFAKILFAVAAVLFGLVIYKLVHHRAVTKAAMPDAATTVMAADPGSLNLDAGASAADSGLSSPSPSATDAGVPLHLDASGTTLAAIDAAAPALTADAALVADAGIPPDARIDRASEARQLMAQANAALDESDAELALQLAEQSVKLRRTARAFLVEAQALQRLSRFDEALAATNSAQEQAPQFAQVYSTRGAILWQAGKLEEAKLAYRRYLAIEPTGETANRIRALIGE